jgi:hypothetical protein
MLRQTLDVVPAPDVMLPFKVNCTALPVMAVRPVHAVRCQTWRTVDTWTSHGTM